MKKNAHMYAPRSGIVVSARKAHRIHKYDPSAKFFVDDDEVRPVQKDHFHFALKDQRKRARKLRKQSETEVQKIIAHSLKRMDRFAFRSNKKNEQSAARVFNIQIEKFTTNQWVHLKDGRKCRVDCMIEISPECKYYKHFSGKVIIESRDSDLVRKKKLMALEQDGYTVLELDLRSFKDLDELFFRIVLRNYLRGKRTLPYLRHVSYMNKEMPTPLIFPKAVNMAFNDTSVLDEAQHAMAH